MKTRNTWNQATYLGTTAFWFILVLVWYLRIFIDRFAVPFTGERLSVRSSRWLFFFLMLILVTLGYLLTFRKHRNALSLTVNILFPLEVYLLCIYLVYRPAIVWVCLGIFGLLLPLYLYLIWSYHPKRRVDKTKLLLQKTQRSLHGAHVLAGVCLSVLVAMLVLSKLFGVSLMQSSTKAVAGSSQGVNTISVHMQELLKLQESEWTKLSMNEKADVMQTVCNIEADYLGLPRSLPVSLNFLGNATNGEFSEKDQKISLSIEMMTDAKPDKCLETTLHEVYHYYQWCLVQSYQQTSEEYRNLQLFSDVAKYEENFENPRDGNEDFDSYYAQAIEVNARKYASDGVADYYRRLDEHIHSVDE